MHAYSTLAPKYIKISGKKEYNNVKRRGEGGSTYFLVFQDTVCLYETIYSTEKANIYYHKRQILSRNKQNMWPGHDGKIN